MGALSIEVHDRGGEPLAAVDVFRLAEVLIAVVAQRWPSGMVQNSR